MGYYCVVVWVTRGGVDSGHWKSVGVTTVSVFTLAAAGFLFLSENYMFTHTDKAMYLYIEYIISI